jgi:alpha-beta hydrolase superfamily lysophospholipase
MKGQESTKTKAYKLIPKVKIPILFLRGWNDRLVENLETIDLAKIANEASNNSATIKYIPGARHNCMENPSETTTAICNWISLLNYP